MNIFYTNNDPSICANDHCTIHVNKMITESTQMLSTAMRILDPCDDRYDKFGLHKITHQNHPCGIWVRQSLANYTWLYRLYEELCHLYFEHKGKEHKCYSLHYELQFPPNGLPKGDFTEPPKCMPDEFKVDSVEESYKRYLNFKYHNWTTRTDKRKMKVDWYNGKPQWANY